jgi:hypothetical protein
MRPAVGTHQKSSGCFRGTRERVRLLRSSPTDGVETSDVATPGDCQEPVQNGGGKTGISLNTRGQLCLLGRRAPLSRASAGCYEPPLIGRDEALTGTKQEGHLISPRRDALYIAVAVS